jgi:hypothetical protein
MSLERPIPHHTGLVAGIGFIWRRRHFEVGRRRAWRRGGRQHLEYRVVGASVAQNRFLLAGTLALSESVHAALCCSGEGQTGRAEPPRQVRSQPEE